MKIKLIRAARDNCGCETFKQVRGGIEVGGLVLKQCPSHQKEFDERHTKAMQDYRLGQRVIASGDG